MRTSFLCVFAAIAVISAIILAASENTSALKEYQRIGATQTISGEQGTTSGESETAYILGEFNGMLAVFRAGSDIPAEVFSVMVKTLPEKDRKQLAAGIEIHGESALRRAVEDYTG